MARGMGVLSKDSQLQGTRLVRTYLRPQRTAFIVPDNDPTVIEAVIASCSMTWGGILNPIVPCHPGENLSADWVKILIILDPDEIIDCVGLEEDDRKELADHGWSIDHKRSLSQEQLNVHPHGTPIWDVFNTIDDKDATGADGNNLVLNPVAISRPEWHLPGIARHGLLTPTSNVQRCSYPNENCARYSHHYPVRHIDVSRDQIATFVGSRNRLLWEFAMTGTFHVHNMLFKTLVGLRGSTIGSSRYRVFSEEAHEPQFHDRVIVVGEEGSVRDLCLYWNLRTERIPAAPFPLWVPYNVLVSGAAKEILSEALGLAGTPEQRHMRDHHYIHVVSDSMVIRDMLSLVEFSDLPIQMAEVPISSYFAGDWNYCNESVEHIVYFENGLGYIPNQSKNLSGGRDKLGPLIYEVEIDGLQMLGSLDLLRLRPTGSFAGDARITRRGNMTTVTNEFSGPHLPCTVPTGWNFIDRYMSTRGYNATPTAKSRLSIGIWNLFAGKQAIMMLQSSKILGMLRTMCVAKHGGVDNKSRLYHSGRAVWKYSDIVNCLENREVAHPITASLVKHGLLLRGVTLTCPICNFRQGHPLERMTDSWQCDGCLQRMAIPVNPGTMNWSYRINELLAAAFDQGAITPLVLMLNWEHEIKPWGPVAFGYYPGIELKAIPGHAVPFDHVEIDCVAVIGGRLTIAECKESAAYFTARDYEKTMALAEHLDCEQVVFATSSTLNDSSDNAWPERKSGTVRCDAWDSARILDPNPYIAWGDEGAEEDEVRASEYLREILLYLEA